MPTEEQINRVKRWIDRQLDGEIELVIGKPGNFPIQILDCKIATINSVPVVEKDTVLCVVCAGGTFFIDDNCNHHKAEIHYEGTA